MSPACGTAPACQPVCARQGAAPQPNTGPLATVFKQALRGTGAFPEHVFRKKNDLQSRCFITAIERIGDVQFDSQLVGAHSTCISDLRIHDCAAACDRQATSRAIGSFRFGSLIGGFISAMSLVAANYTVSYVTYRNKKIAAIIEGRPQVLIHNGQLYADVMRNEKVTQHELNVALRAAGVADISDVHFAVLECNGQINISALHSKAEIS
jgi:hypothetical protein